MGDLSCTALEQADLAILSGSLRDRTSLRPPSSRAAPIHRCTIPEYYIPHSCPRPLPPWPEANTTTTTTIQNTSVQPRLKYLYHLQLTLTTVTLRHRSHVVNATLTTTQLSTQETLSRKTEATREHVIVEANTTTTPIV